MFILSVVLFTLGMRTVTLIREYYRNLIDVQLILDVSNVAISKEEREQAKSELTELISLVQKQELKLELLNSDIQNILSVEGDKQNSFFRVIKTLNAPEFEQLSNQMTLNKDALINHHEKIGIIEKRQNIIQDIIFLAIGLLLGELSIITILSNLLERAISIW